MNQMLPLNTHVTVLRGGNSCEHSLSLDTGKSVMDQLEDTCHVEDVFIDKKGDWYVRGVQKDPHSILGPTDVVYNALHGGGGEDGSIQRLLSMYGVPFTGSKQLSSAFSLQKPQSKEVFKRAGISVPIGSIIRVDNPQAQASSIFKSIRIPLIFKKPFSGSSHGVFVAFSYDDILSILCENIGDNLLIEEYVFGSNVTCGVVESIRGEDVYELLPVEISIGDDHVYQHDKRDSYDMRCPSFLPASTKKEIQSIAKKAHKALHLSHYSQSDFIVTKNGKVYLLETNALPSLGPESPFSIALESVAIDMDQFLRHVLSLALGRK